MTLPEITAILLGVGALGAAIKAGPAVWSFVRNVARIPSMTESIWMEFGRNGGSTTRDRIEHIARKIEDTAALAQHSLDTGLRNDAIIATHFQSDAASFQLIAQRLASIEGAVVQTKQAVDHGTKQEGEHAADAKVAAKRKGSAE